MSKDWQVSLPLDELMALKQQPQMFKELKAENAQLRRELEALRNLFSELITQFGDLKRELKRR